MTKLLKYFRIEILKSEDGKNLEVYVNGNREDSGREKYVLALYGERANNKLR